MSPALAPSAVALLLSLTVLGSAAPAAARPAIRLAEPAIRAVLDLQVAAWTRRDLEGYMAGYWRSPALSFFGGDQDTRGWQPTLERYRRRYQGEGREMGTLSMSEIEVRVLSASQALVRGRWKLTFTGGKESAGLYTLLFERRHEGWKIVHDHSSGATPPPCPPQGQG